MWGVCGWGVGGGDGGVGVGGGGDFVHTIICVVCMLFMCCACANVCVVHVLLRVRLHVSRKCYVRVLHVPSTCRVYFTHVFCVLCPR